MRLYTAPLEGITGHVFRTALNECFGPADKYFIPFIKPNQRGHFSSREKEDILPEHNRGMYAVPQILTNSVDDFVRTAKKLQSYGYREINLNLGCPSGTVVSKGRGAGFLAFPDELDRFLDGVFAQTEAEISIKTRIGKDSPEEFGRLLEIYGKYPVKELIIHPRIQKDQYKYTPRWEVFREACQKSRIPLCYNGDLFSAEAYRRAAAAFSEVDTWMFGRGLLMNPGLCREIRQGIGLDKETLRRFHDKLYGDYQGVLPGAKTVLFKMKELWSFLAPAFTDCHKYAKRIKKAEKLPVYEAAVNDLFAEQSLEVHEP